MHFTPHPPPLYILRVSDDAFRDFFSLWVCLWERTPVCVGVCARESKSWWRFSTLFFPEEKESLLTSCNRLAFMGLLEEEKNQGFVLAWLAFQFSSFHFFFLVRLDWRAFSHGTFGRTSPAVVWRKRKKVRLLSSSPREEQAGGSCALCIFVHKFCVLFICFCPRPHAKCCCFSPFSYRFQSQILQLGKWEVSFCDIPSLNKFCFRAFSVRLVWIASE